jgi:hypothetical protein
VLTKCSQIGPGAPSKPCDACKKAGKACEWKGKKSCERCTIRKQQCHFDGRPKNKVVPRGANRVKKEEFVEGTSKRPIRQAAASASTKLTAEALAGLERDRGDRFGKWTVEGLGKLYHHQQVRVKHNVCNDLELFSILLRGALDMMIDNIDVERSRLNGVRNWAEEVQDDDEVDQRVADGDQSSRSEIVDDGEASAADADGEEAN